MVCIESSAEISPWNLMSHGVCCQMICPLDASRTLELVCHIQSLLSINAANKTKFLLNGAKPIISLQWFFSSHEYRRMSFEEVSIGFIGERILMTLRYRYCILC